MLKIDNFRLSLIWCLKDREHSSAKSTELVDDRVK
jgi:hypothetical protein